MGADGIEIDVETASDGSLVVINRWFANKTFGFFPWERDLDMIRACGLEKGIEIPAFDEVCQLIKGYPEAVFNVEIKSSDRFLCRTAKQAGKSIRRFGIGHQVVISSFDMNTLLTARRYCPGIETAYLFRMEDRVTELKEKGSFKYKINGYINRSGMKALLAGADTLHPEIKLVNENRRALWEKYAELSGRRINCWTVDTEKDFKKAIRIGADLIISDNPERAVRYRSRIQKDTES